MMMRHDVKHIFGYPGGAILPVFDAIHESEQFQLILPRHEQGAGHMAEGYAKATGKPGVVLVTSGPGATNVITPLQDALSDGVALVVFSGQVPTTAIGTDAFQEADIIGISRSCTKWNVMVKNIEELPRRINEAFAIATSGRPGPVLVDLPKDVTASVLQREVSCEPLIPAVPNRVSSVSSMMPAHIARAADMINRARRPVIYAGQGVMSSEGGVEMLKQLALGGNIPVTTTLQGLGAFDELHELSLHMLGMHGSAYANLAVQNADVLIAIGARFDDRVTMMLSKFAPAAKKAALEGTGGIIHFEILPKNINKVVDVDIAVEGDVTKSLKTLMPAIKHRKRVEWIDQVQGWKQMYPFRYDNAFEKKENMLLKPQEVIEELNLQLSSQMAGNRSIITTGVGQHQMWTAQYLRWRKPRSFITSGGLGTMGFGLPSAIGAKIAKPNNWVVDIDGDASFAMTGMELMTASEFDVGVKVMILNNGFQGMVRQWQDLFYEQRYSATKMTNPDFVKLAESMHCTGLRITNRQELREGMREFLFADQGNEGSGKRPVLLDCVVEAAEHVYPMVPAGKGLHEMVLGAKQAVA